MTREEKIWKILTDYHRGMVEWELKGHKAKYGTTEVTGRALAQLNALDKVNHNCTTMKMAEQIDVPLWKVMELGKYFKSKFKPEVDEGKLYILLGKFNASIVETHKMSIDEYRKWRKSLTHTIALNQDKWLK